MSINIKMQTNRAVLYQVGTHERNVSLQNLANRRNFQDKFTAKVRSKIMELVESWFLTTQYANNIGKEQSIKFLTLTIPVTQTFCDKTIVQKCLLPFLKSGGNYLYVCERQKNGNIHFHTIIDWKTKVSQIRTDWNGFLETLGIISQYKQDREEFFKSGFVFQDNGFSLIQQQIWYSFGVATRWKNPHTVDYRQISHNGQIGAYITKYITKGGNAHLCCNRWGKSQLIGKLSSPKIEEKDYDNKDIEWLYSLANNILDFNDYVRIIQSTDIIKNLEQGSKLKKRVDWHFYIQANNLYP